MKKNVNETLADRLNEVEGKATKMLYREYKNKFDGCRTKYNSYEASTKTIIVYVPYTEDEAIEVAKNAWVAWAEIPESDKQNKLDAKAVAGTALSNVVLNYSREGQRALSRWIDEYNEVNGIECEKFMSDGRFKKA